MTDRDPTEARPGLDPAGSDLEQRLREHLQTRAVAVRPAPGAWSTIRHRTVGRPRRRLVTIGLPAMAAAAVLAVVGVVALNRDPGAGPRVRTNPALPGDGPPEASTTSAVPSPSPLVVTEGSGWRLLFERRGVAEACAQVRPRGDDGLDPTFCGASEAELDDRGVSLAFTGVQMPGGSPTTLPPRTVAYGFVPEEAADVVFSVEAGPDIAFPALPVVGGPDAFAGELPPGAAVTRIVVYDGDGRVLYDEELRAAD